MPNLKLPALLRRLGERPPSAAVFLYGPEEYLRERAVRTVVDLFLDPATKDFNFDQLRGSDADADVLASVLATPPMMAGYRVVVVREAQGLGPRARQVVEAAVDSPPAGLVVIVVATIPGGSRAKFYDTLRSRALSVEFGVVDAEDLPGWIVEHGAAEHAVEIEIEAARAWAAAIGPELGVLATEIEKAVAYIGDRRRVTIDDVKAVGGYVPRVDRWRWLDLVGERKFAFAIEQLPDLLDSGETAVGLVLAMGSHLLRLGMAVDGGGAALERHLSQKQRWLVRKLQTQARGWTVARIDRALEDLLRTDRLLKTVSTLGDRGAMEELLLRLASDDADPGAARMRPEAVVASA